MSAEKEQPSSAASAACANAAESHPGTTPLATIADATIRCPTPSTSSIVMVQWTSSRSGGVRARASSPPSDVT